VSVFIIEVQANEIFDPITNILLSRLTPVFKLLRAKIFLTVTVRFGI